MDSYDMFTRDKAQLDEDLKDLINSAAAVVSSANSSSSIRPISSSPSVDQRLHNCSSSERRPVKRIKLEHPVQGPGALATLSVHPSRRALLEIPPPATSLADQGFAVTLSNDRGDIQLRDEVQLLQRTGSNTIPLGKARERIATGSLDSDHVARRDLALSSRLDEPDTIGQDYVYANGKTKRSTLRSVVRRQWDSSMDDIPYEKLLENRRTEHLDSNVDRYVPLYTVPQVRRIATRPCAPSSFPYSKLPEKIRAQILAHLLVSHEPIVVDCTWLRSFVNGHCRVPIIEKAVKDITASTYTVSMEWHQIVRDVSTMRKDCIPFKPALEDCGNKTRGRKGPCRALTTGILLVSKGVHAQAASVFYRNNSFRFPVPGSAWMQLEAFLATIGPINVGKLRSITIHCPLWHRGIKEDFLEGAILDLTSPASRFGVVRSSSRDRLLSAIAGSVEALSKAGRLETLALELEHGLNAERWAGSYSNTCRLIAMAEADEHVSRKTEGIQLLKRLSEGLPSRPVLTVYHQTPVIGKHDLSEFRSRLASIIREAAKYSWKVDQRLQGRRV